MYHDISYTYICLQYVKNATLSVMDYNFLSKTHHKNAINTLCLKDMFCICKSHCVVVT